MSTSRHKKRRDRLARAALVSSGLSTDETAEDDLKRLNSALNSQDLWIGEVPRIARKAKLKRIAERRERSRLLDC